LAQSWQSNYFLKNFATIWEVKRYGARYYDPSLQRFLSEDPIGFSSGDFNFYGYVKNSPLNYNDPSGKFWNFVIGAGLGAGLDLFIQLARNGWNIDCVNWYSVGASAALGVLGVAGAGTKGLGKEFSHWIPNRAGGPRSIWNGNYVPKNTHALSDPYRYRFMPRTWKGNNPMYNPFRKHWVRFPNAGKGVGAGAGLGFLPSDCSNECQ